MKSNGFLVLALAVLLIVCFGALSVFGVGTGHVAAAAGIRPGLDLKSGVTILYKAGNEATEAEMTTDVEIIWRRLGAYNYAGARVSRQGADQIRVDIPNAVGADQAAQEIGAAGMLYFLDEEGSLLLTSDDVAKVTASNQASNGYGIALQFTNAGATKFAEATQNNIGKVIYVYLDGSMLARPQVNEAITGGMAVIPLGATAQGANQLAALINDGPMPVPLSAVSVKETGPAYGENAMRNLVLAGMICLAMILLFMPLFYKGLGVAADLSLLLFIGLILAFVSLTRIHLTLPAVAGMVLSAGLFVDAVVVLFERTRDEIAAGKNPRQSADTGFKRAFPAILDAHILAAVAALLTYFIGTGPVRDFALALMLGVPASALVSIGAARFIIKALIDAGASDSRIYIRAKREANS